MRRNRIADYRIAKGWAQSELAQRVGVTQAAISQYEIGLVMPRMATLFQLTEVLGCTVDDLYPRES